MAVSAMRWDVTVFLRGTGYVGLVEVFELVSVSSATRFDRGLSLVVR